LHLLVDLITVWRTGYFEMPLWGPRAATKASTLRADAPLKYSSMMIE
jgi:hypothetical protein